jgi:membrane protease subunit HflK
MIRRPAWFLIPGCLVAAGYLASGITIVQPDEVGVVRRCGAVLREPWEPGLHWGLPWGIDRIERIQVSQTRTMAVGAPGPGAAPLARAPDSRADDFLTGDLNLVTAEAVVQYRVRDPVAYLLRAKDVEASLRALSEWALTRALARRGIDELLTTGRAEVAEGLSRAIQSLSDAEGLGVVIVAVRLGRVAPPAAVAPAFADAARARSDRRQAITRAEEYRDRSQSEGRGQAREIADAAAGQVDRLVEPARGEAERFTRLLAEAHKAPGSFRRRLFLETIAELLPRFRRKVVVPAGQDLDLSLFEDEPAPVAAPGTDSGPGRIPRRSGPPVETPGGRP